MASPPAAWRRWLPATEPDRSLLLRLFERIEQLGLDPIAEMLAVRESFPCPPRAIRRGSTSGVTDGGRLEFEPLDRISAPCLWPHRPKRLPEELFSSWLWRAACLAAAPPRRFAAEALGGVLPADPDQEVGRITVRRLASLTGQQLTDLLGGLLRPLTASSDDEERPMHDLLLQHDPGFLLRRPVPTRRRSGIMPVLQYCPCCLAGDAAPHFRRRWRFATEVACLEHGVRLHDRCWACGTAVAPLGMAVPRAEPACPACGVLLAGAPALPASPKGLMRQVNLGRMLRHVGRRLDSAGQAAHVGHLRAAGLHGALAVADRERLLARFRASEVKTWFGLPDEPAEADALQRLARGGRPVEGNRARWGQ